MANIRLNIFHQYPIFHVARILGGGIGTQKFQGIELVGSISFNNIAVLLSAAGTAGQTASIYMGLYSLNGGTLSMANSASGSFASAGNAFSWVTLATSATQDITPGNWYLGFNWLSSGDSRFSFLNNSFNNAISGGAYGGIFVRGISSSSSNNLAATVATSDLQKEGEATGGLTSYPHFIISA